MELDVKILFMSRGVGDPNNIPCSGVSLIVGPIDTGSLGSTNKSRTFNRAITTAT